MKLLFLSPYLPSPPQSGAPRRVQGLLNELSQRHEVSLLALVAPNENTSEAIEATRAYCKEVVVVESNRLDRALGHRRKRILQFASLPQKKSYERITHYHPEFQKELDRLTARTTYDVITTEHCQLDCYRLPASMRLMLDEHNIEYDILSRTTAAEPPSPRKLYSWINHLKLRSEERASWRRYTGIALTSKRDEQILRDYLPAKPTAVIPNAVDTNFFQPSTATPEPDNILFFGAINYYPNTDGLLFFLDEVFPLIKQQRPSARLTIVGQLPPPSITSRASSDIVVTGLVDDVRTYINRASVVIVPLRIGGGTRLKIVEAMSMGKPIVSTQLGAEGIEVKHNQDILLADTAPDFAREVVRVLEDDSLAQQLGQAARQRAVAQYSWRDAVQRLEKFYSDLPTPTASHRT